MYLYIYTCTQTHSHAYRTYLLSTYIGIVYYPFKKPHCFTEIAISAMMVVSNIAAEEARFTVLYFPPRICENSSNNLYSSLLPATIASSTLTCMIVTLGWVIYKVYERDRRH